MGQRRMKSRFWETPKTRDKSRVKESLFGRLWRIAEVACIRNPPFVHDLLIALSDDLLAVLVPATA